MRMGLIELIAKHITGIKEEEETDMVTLIYFLFWTRSMTVQYEGLSGKVHELGPKTEPKIASKPIDFAASSFSSSVWDVSQRLPKKNERQLLLFFF